MAKLQTNGMWVGEEVMLTLRELTRDSGFVFTWHKALEAYSSVYGKHYWETSTRWRTSSGGSRGIDEYLKEKRYIHMTLGNLLRGQLKGGTIRRLDKGIYAFQALNVSFPLFCEAGRYGGKYKHGRSDRHPFADFGCSSSGCRCHLAGLSGPRI